MWSHEEPRRPSVKGNLLVCDAVQGGVIVEAEISGVDDVVCASLFGQVVQRAQVSCQATSVPMIGEVR